MNRLIARFFLLGVLLVQPLRGAERQNDLGASAGWAEVEITPPIGISLGGRGAPSAPSKKVLDPLVGQVLFLKDGNGVGFVVVSLDVIGLPHDLSEKLRLDLVHELGVAWNLVVLNFSHTHSGPYMIRSLMAGVDPAPQIEIDYFKSLEEKIISAARATAKKMKPVKVEVFEGKSEVAINRRGKNKSGARGIIPDRDGPFDENLWVLKLTPQNDQPPALLFSYACHPVIVYGFAPTAISADFPGVTRGILRENLGAKAHVQFVQGFAGNVRPRVVADIPNRRFRNSTATDLQKAGSDLARDTLAALKKPGKTLSLKIAGAGDRPFLARDQPPAREYYEKLHKDGLAQTNQFLQRVSEHWLSCYDSGLGFSRGDAWPVGLIRLADNQWICYMAGEPCVEWRAKIQQWLPSKQIVPWGYCQEGIGYLPTKEMLPEGGYEVADSNRARLSTPAQMAPGIDDAVRESLLRQLSFINAEVK